MPGTLKILQVGENERDKWNAYVTSHKNGTAYHRYEWLMSVQRAYGFAPSAWFAQDSKGQIFGVLASVKFGWPLNKLCSLPYCDVGGILADDEHIFNELLNKAFEVSEQNNLKVFEHRQSAENEPENIEREAKVRMLLPLPESSEELLASFKSKLRSQINKAKKNGLTASTGNDKKHLDGFYQVYSRNMRDLGSPAHSKEWFANIVQNYGKNAVIANVYKNSTVVGAGIVLFNGDRVSIPWASTNSDFNKLAPNMLLYWTLLAFVTDRGADEFDFGRSTPGEGTYKFKAQWGAKPQALNWQDYMCGQLQEKNDDSGKSTKRQQIENIWRKLPVSVATKVGSKVRKYITL